MMNIDIDIEVRLINKIICKIIEVVYRIVDKVIEVGI